MKLYKKIYNFYIKKDEESLIKYLIPELYIDNNIDKNKIRVDYAIRFLQNEMNSILNSFVNGGFSNKGYILYPFIKDVSKDNIKKIMRLRKVAVFLNKNKYDFSESINQFKSEMNSKSFAQILSALYKDFSKIESKGSRLEKKGKCKEVDLRKYKKSDVEYVKPLEELKKYANRNLKQYLLGFYLHGSLATKDYIRQWSDVDTISIISKETLKDPKKLLKLRNKMYYVRRFFYEIDPLQHHGSIIISEYDLDNYCQAYFPVPIFEYAKSFFKDDKVVQFKVRDFSSESLKKLFWFVSYFRKLNTEKKFNLGSYDTKILLHNITLFPTMYLQARGILMYKKFSFDMAKKDFKKDIWKIMDDISSMRLNWKGFKVAPLINSFSELNPLFYYQLNSRVIDLFKDIKKENKIDVRYIVKNMFKFSEEAWRKIKENVKS